jgi:hypothetical protein
VRRPTEEAPTWAEKLEECDRLRSAYQDQQAMGLMSLEELGSKLKGLDETRRLARAELEVLESRDLLGQVRLSCQALCDHDMKVRVLMTVRSTGLDGPIADRETAGGEV